jgi:Phospholipase_D-nuclease N-terminal
MTVTLPGTLQMLLGLYGYLLPMLLYMVWSTLALWDLGRRDTVSSGAVWLWALAIFLLPFVGALGYLLLGGAQLGSRTRLVAVAGGAAIYALVLVVGSALGGIT